MLYLGIGQNLKPIPIKLPVCFEISIVGRERSWMAMLVTQLKLYHSGVVFSCSEVLYNGNRDRLTKHLYK